MTPSSGASTPKIAIKGFSLYSKIGAARSGSKPQLSSNLGKRPRSTFAHGDESDDDDRRPKAEVVTGFGEEGAIRQREKKREGPLVIEGLENTSGLGMKRGAGMKNLLPPEVVAARERARGEREGGIVFSAASGAASAEVKTEQAAEVLNGGEEKAQWGLNVRKRVKAEDEGTSADSQTKAEEGTNGTEDSNHEINKDEEKEGEEEKPRTADEEALAALLGQETKKKGPDLVIPSTTNTTTRPQPLSEEDAYRRAIASAPDVSTLEDYERIPVEEFGAALLRGMGWKGEKTGTVKEVKRRQNLLGLGAKELDGAEELGAWVQKSDVKRLKPAGSRAGGYGGTERKPKVSEYKREEERRRERREERGGGSYRRDREREREYERDDRREKDRNYERRDRRR